MAEVMDAYAAYLAWHHEHKDQISAVAGILGMM